MKSSHRDVSHSCSRAPPPRSCALTSPLFSATPSIEWNSWPRKLQSWATPASTSMPRCFKVTATVCSTILETDCAATWCPLVGLHLLVLFFSGCLGLPKRSTAPTCRLGGLCVSRLHKSGTPPLRTRVALRLPALTILKMGHSINAIKCCFVAPAAQSASTERICNECQVLGACCTIRVHCAGIKSSQW